MRYMLDTGIAARIIENRGTARQHFASAQRPIGISTLAVAELRFGVAKSKSKAMNAAKLDLFLAGEVDQVPFAEDDATTAGTLRATMEAAGTVLGHYDLLIAAQALRIGATLVTADKAFGMVDGLVTEDWQ